MIGLTGFLGDVLRSNTGMRKRPYKLNFSITDRCNSRCSNCNIWRTENSEEMSLEEIEGFFEANPYLSWISLTGGEPFLREDIVGIAESAFERMEDLFLLNIPTNGFLTEEILDRVEKIAEMDIPKIYVTVSVDGTEDVHDELRGVDGAWKKAVKTYDGLRKLSRKYSNLGSVMTYTVHEQNSGVFEKTVEAVDGEIGAVDFSDFNITFHHSSEHYYRNGDEVSLDRERLESILGNYGIGITPEEIVNLMFLFNSREELYGNRMDCVAGTDSLFMMPNGDVYPCTVLNRKLGNVLEEGMSLGKYSDRFESGGKECDGCWMPCEANQRMLAHLPESFYRFVKNYLVNRRKR